ncbi:MAG TPA: tRNA (adenosine(37)-N6)-threonylcarbamoyltransferase complex ATPase subunit type 1 TsaE, partial [Ruminococcaceae bacterium]|nr:tRNA (adenosine(37)-N6)-threonylcarbamoyltransferase complex ATPase subunit type 1 TsaE [Oscillospiraceae bacterium]
MKKTFYSQSVQQTEQIGSSLAKLLHRGDVVAFFGGLGMGKTAFVRGLARGMGV